MQARAISLAREALVTALCTLVWLFLLIWFWRARAKA